MSDHHKVVSSEGLLIKDQDLMALLDRSDLVSNAALQRKSGRPKKGQEHNGLFRVLATDIPASQWAEDLSRGNTFFFFILSKSSLFRVFSVEETLIFWLFLWVYLILLLFKIFTSLLNFCSMRYRLQRNLNRGEIQWAKLAGFHVSPYTRVLPLISDKCSETLCS